MVTTTTQDTLPEQIDQALGESEPNAPSEQQSENPFVGRIKTLEELFDTPTNEDWLIHDLLCRGDVAMLYGDSGIGKSFLGVDLSMALATGTSWAGGQFDVARSARVVYTAGEGQRGLRKRWFAIDAYYREKGLIQETPKNINFIPIVPQLFDSSNPESVYNFIEACKKLEKIDLVVIDTLNRAMLGGDENSAKDASIVLQSTSRIVKELGAAVLIIHHESRNGNERGSTAFRAGYDVVLRARKKDATVTLQCDKVKDSVAFADIAYELQSYEESAIVNWNGTHTSLTGAKLPDRIITLMLTNPEKWWTAAELAKGLSYDHPTNLAKKMVEKIAIFEHKPLFPDKEQKRGDTKNPTVYRLLDSYRENLVHSSSS